MFLVSSIASFVLAPGLGLVAAVPFLEEGPLKKMRLYHLELARCLKLVGEK